MFPIKDHNPSDRIPFVTYALIIANIAIYVLSIAVAPNDYATYQLYDAYALIPRDLLMRGEWGTVLTSMFMHGGLMHLAGNMLFLWIFGDNMEDAFGHIGFILFYLAGGAAAAMAQVASGPNSMVPMVGASGAIAAVMGGYILLFPKARVDILIFFVIFIRIIPLPAWIMLGLWMGMQIFGGLASSADTGGVAYWAHAGGFAAGVILTIPVFLSRGAGNFWRRNDGHPPHPEAQYQISQTRIPRVTRKR